MLNEEQNLQELYASISKVMSKISEDYRIVFVDDGSTDGTATVLRDLHRLDDRVAVIRFRKRFGQSAALTAGFRYASGDIIISMDSDLQNSPDDILKLLEKLNEGYDVVCGWRRDRKDSFFSKRVPSAISNWMARRLSGTMIHDFGCTMRAYKRTAVSGVHVYGELHRFLPALIAWKGFKVTEVPVSHHPRRHGKSKYGLRRIFRGLIDLITAYLLERYLSRPMHIFGLFGFVVGITGFALALYLAVLRLFYSIPIGERPLLLLAVLMILMGMQSAVIGLIGEMMTRYQIEAKDKVFYEIEEILFHQGYSEHNRARSREVCDLH